MVALQKNVVLIPCQQFNWMQNAWPTKLFHAQMFCTDHKTNIVGQGYVGAPIMGGVAETQDGMGQLVI